MNKAEAVQDEVLHHEGAVTLLSVNCISAAEHLLGLQTWNAAAQTLTFGPLRSRWLFTWYDY